MSKFRPRSCKHTCLVSSIYINTYTIAALLRKQFYLQASMWKNLDITDTFSHAIVTFKALSLPQISKRNTRLLSKKKILSILSTLNGKYYFSLFKKKTTLNFKPDRQTSHLPTFFFFSHPLLVTILNLSHVIINKQLFRSFPGNLLTSHIPWIPLKSVGIPWMTVAHWDE